MKKTFILTATSISSVCMFSLYAHAQGNNANDAITGISTLATLVEAVNTRLVKAIGTLFLSSGVVAFFYGVVLYVWGARKGDATAIKNGNEFLKWSIIALFLMFSIYGLIKWTQNIIGIKDVDTIIIPEVDFRRGTGSPTNNPVGGSPLGAPTNGNTGSNTGGAGTSNPYRGADCTANSDCSGGLTCSNFKCQ